MLYSCLQITLRNRRDEKTEGGGDSGEAQFFECRRCKVLKKPNLSGKRIEDCFIVILPFLSFSEPLNLAALIFLEV